VCIGYWSAASIRFVRYYSPVLCGDCRRGLCSLFQKECQWRLQWLRTTVLHNRQECVYHLTILHICSVLLRLVLSVLIAAYYSAGLSISRCQLAVIFMYVHTPYGIWDGNAPWHDYWFWHCINCLFVYLTSFLLSFLLYFLLSLCFFLAYLLPLIYFLTYLLLPE